MAKKRSKQTGLSYTKERKLLKPVFSAYIRSLGDGCELHQRAHKKKIKLPIKCSGSIQCCHKLPKARYPRLEFVESNVFRGCSSSNFWEQSHRDLWFPIVEQLWPGDLDWLKELNGYRSKQTADGLRLLRLQYQSRLKEGEK